jgi:hypothetical protein
MSKDKGNKATKTAPSTEGKKAPSDYQNGKTATKVEQTPILKKKK